MTFLSQKMFQFPYIIATTNKTFVQRQQQWVRYFAQFVYSSDILEIYSDAVSFWMFQEDHVPVRSNILALEAQSAAAAAAAAAATAAAAAITAVAAALASATARAVWTSWLFAVAHLPNSMKQHSLLTVCLSEQFVFLWSNSTIGAALQTVLYLHARSLIHYQAEVKTRGLLKLFNLSSRHRQSVTVVTAATAATATTAFTAAIKNVIHQNQSRKKQHLSNSSRRGRS